MPHKLNQVGAAAHVCQCVALTLLSTKAAHVARERDTQLQPEAEVRHAELPRIGTAESATPRADTRHGP